MTEKAERDFQLVPVEYVPVKKRFGLYREVLEEFLNSEEDCVMVSIPEKGTSQILQGLRALKSNIPFKVSLRGDEVFLLRGDKLD